MAVLAVDIALPIPSSVVVAYAASQLGIAATVALGTLGLTLSCETGYWAARLFGHRLAEPGERPAEGPTLLVVAATRAVPLLAEATVMLAGATRQPHTRFAVVAVAANGLVCMLYATLGRYGFAAGRELVALAVSVAVPVLLSGAVWLAGRRSDAAPQGD